jgi:hypothetical protein
LAGVAFEYQIPQWERRSSACLGKGAVLDAVKGIVLAPELAAEADALVMVGEAVWCESDIARGKRKTANPVEDRERVVALIVHSSPKTWSVST